MSQKKVDAYKAQKANREKIMKKEKAIQRLEKLAVAVVCVFAVCWLGYSLYDKVVSVQDTVVTETVMNVSALDDYLQDLSLQLEDTAEEVPEAEKPEGEDEEGAVSDEESADVPEEAGEEADEAGEDAPEDTQDEEGASDDSEENGEETQEGEADS